MLLAASCFAGLISFFISRPAGDSFQVEIAANRGKTSWSFDGKYATAWGDGEDHPDDYHDSNCISSPLRAHLSPLSPYSYLTAHKEKTNIRAEIRLKR